ncbi:ankyrin repeat protein [Pelomyxa schiedti]|nr:ankyrin repeat protein [Pelomyxa schiedti]
MTAAQADRIAREDKYRKLFVADPTNAELKDPYLLLTNIYENSHKYVYEAMDPDEEAVPKLFSKLKQPRPIGEPSIVPQSTFKKNWEDFTCGILNGMNWEHVFVAGGSVLACLQPNGMETAKGSDIDLFLWGLASDEEANAKLREIYQVVSRNTEKAGPFHNTRAITILCNFPYRHVQIILKRYISPAEVLLSFDVDSCCVGYDGSALWGSDERLTIALNKGYNLLNSSRRSLTYEIRLFKYAKRGFTVAVPTLEKARVDPSICRKSSQFANGLQKLLIFEFQTLHPQEREHISYTASLRRMLSCGRNPGNNTSEEFLSDKIEEYVSREANNPSDYSEVFIPWGPGWKPDVILRILKMRDQAEVFSAIHKIKKGASGTAVHRHCFVAGIEDVIAGRSNMYWCNLCKAKAPLSGEENGKFVSGPLTWVTGYSQGGVPIALPGSFHPVLNTPYFDNIYLKEGQRCTVTPHPLQDLMLPGGSASFPVVQTKSAANPKYICSTCSKMFSTQSALNVHEREVHIERTDFKPFTGATTSLFATATDTAKTTPDPTKPGFDATVEALLPGSNANTLNLPTGRLLPLPDALNAQVPLPSPLSFGTQPAPSPAPFFFGAPGHTFPKATVLSPPQPLSLPSHNNLPKLTDKVSKLLLLIATLARMNLIKPEVKAILKDMIVNRNDASNMLSALEAFEIDNDIGEVADTLTIISKKSSP